MSTDDSGIKEIAKVIGVDLAKDGSKDRTVIAPIERRHISLVLWLQNITKSGYGVKVLDLLAGGGIVTIPSSAPDIDNYSRHVVSLKGQLGPCAMFYDGTELVKMTLALHGFAIIGGLRPPQAHAITGTHVRGYKLDIAEIRLGMDWGKVGD